MSSSLATYDAEPSPTSSGRSLLAWPVNQGEPASTASYCRSSAGRDVHQRSRKRPIIRNMLSYAERPMSRLPKMPARSGVRPVSVANQLGTAFVGSWLRMSSSRPSASQPARERKRRNSTYSRSADKPPKTTSTTLCPPLGSAYRRELAPSRGKRHESEPWQPAPPGRYSHASAGPPPCASYAYEGQYIGRFVSAAMRSIWERVKKRLP